MTQKDLISIILPTYNRATFLERSINSVISQTHPHRELLIIDDGSHDNTRQIIERYLSTNKNIFYYHRQHSGIGMSRNFGIQQANGYLLTYIDSDDRYEPDHLLSRINFLKKNPSIDFIYGTMKIIGDPYVEDLEHPGNKIHFHDTCQGATIFGYTKNFQEIGYGNEKYGEDYHFFQKAKKVFSIEKVPFETYVYRRGSNDELTKRSFQL